MSTDTEANPAQVKAYVRLLGNPYASLAFSDDPGEAPQSEPTLEQKRAYLRELQNPHAFDAVFGEPDVGDTSAERASRAAPELAANPLQGDAMEASREKTVVSIANVESVLDEVLHLYKPYVARKEWARVTDFRTAFLQRAKQAPRGTERVVAGLRAFKFSLLPGEKVQYNRAPAQRLIAELEKLLG